MPGPRKSARTSKKPLTAVPPTSAAVVPGHEAIARRAYELFVEQGCEHGRDLENWLAAEAELAQSTVRSRSAA